MPTDPRIDAAIESAPAYAQPILRRLRAAVHAACPGATEDIKWGRPFFLLDDKPFAMMAAFKAHCTFGFWRLGKPEKETGGGGQYGRITTVADLPDEARLSAEIRAAAETVRAERGLPRAKPAPRPPIEPPTDLMAALAAMPPAQTTFDALPPGARREYLEWIVEAKKAETRARHIEKAVAQLAEGRKLHDR